MVKLRKPPEQSDSISDAIAYYDFHADALASNYEGLSFEDVHPNILTLLPKFKAKILDVGAGSGRDANALAVRGHQVWAVEPSRELSKIGKEKHHQSIKWINDRLPDLESLNEEKSTFDLILLSAVWMHIQPDESSKALCTLVELLNNSGLLIITLRMGEANEALMMFPVCKDELVVQGKELGLVEVSCDFLSDKLGRDEVHWISLVFRKSKN